MRFQGFGSRSIAPPLGYVTVGTNDLKRAGEFYDAVLGVLGGTCSREGERLIMWSGRPAGAAEHAVITPFDKSAAAPGNGTMIALAGGDPETVQAVHAKALAMGASTKGHRVPAAPATSTAVTFGTLTVTNWLHTAVRR